MEDNSCPGAIRRSAKAALLALALVASVSCGAQQGDDEATAPTPNPGESSTPSSVEGAHDAAAPAAAETYDVGQVERTYVDDTRPTVAHGGQPELPERTLDVLVLYPAESAGVEAQPLEGEWPLIVFSHGSTRSGVDYIDTLSWWASAGYVVAAPDFPLSKEGTPGGTNYTDFEAQTADVSFVVDEVLTDADANVPLGELVDPERIGAGGQSFGAITTIGVVAAACCADDRIDAATEFAGMWLPFSSGTELSPTATETPVLFVHGDADPTIPYESGRAAWNMLGARSSFLTLVGSGHDDGFFGGGSTPLDRLVSESTLAFYDSHLKADPSALDRLRDLVGEAGADVAVLDMAES